MLQNELVYGIMKALKLDIVTNVGIVENSLDDLRNNIRKY